MKHQPTNAFAAIVSYLYTFVWFGCVRVQIAGEAGAGKTQLCLQLLLQVRMMRGKCSYVAATCSMQQQKTTMAILVYTIKFSHP